MERHRCVPVFNIVSVFKTTSTSAVTPPSFKTGIVKKKKITLIYFVPACVHLRVCSRSKALMWNSENSLWELVSSFYLVGPGNWTQLVRLCSGHLYLLTHLTYKIWFFFFFNLRFNCRFHYWPVTTACFPSIQSGERCLPSGQLFTLGGTCSSRLFYSTFPKPWVSSEQCAIWLNRWGHWGSG